MRYAAAFIMACVFLLGAGLLCAVGWESVAQIRRSPYLKRTEGKIIEIRLEKRIQRSRKGRSIGEETIGIPIISFVNENGETSIFDGLIGVEKRRLDKHGYKIGNKIPVVYDTRKKSSPSIDSPLFSVGLAAFALFGLMMTGSAVIFFKFFWWDERRSCAQLETAPMP